MTLAHNIQGSQTRQITCAQKKKKSLTSSFRTSRTQYNFSLTHTKHIGVREATMKTSALASVF